MIYIIDASEMKAPILEFLLDIKKENGQQFFTSAYLYGSNDLKKWNEIDSNTILANLIYKGESLVKNIIKLPNGSYKYYRINWLNESSLKISNLTAKFGKKYDVQMPKLNWLPVNGTQSKNDKTLFTYKLNGYFPVSSVKVEFNGPNSFANVVLEARNSENENWQYRESKRVYSIQRDGAKIEENEISFTPKRFKYWRLKFKSNMDSFGNGSPKLHFGWASEKLRFLARGTSPFLLAFGSARTLRSSSTHLQEEIFSGSVGIAKLGELRVLSGESKLTYTPPKVYPWKIWVLWGVLILGIISLGKMAIGLLKNMKDDDHKP